MDSTRITSILKDPMVHFVYFTEQLKGSVRVPYRLSTQLPNDLALEETDCWIFDTVVNERTQCSWVVFIVVRHMCDDEGPVSFYCSDFLYGLTFAFSNSLTDNAKASAKSNKVTKPWRVPPSLWLAFQRPYFMRVWHLLHLSKVASAFWWPLQLWWFFSNPSPPFAVEKLMPLMPLSTFYPVS